MALRAEGSQRRLRIGFVHPDLGIGGAERLVVDAALGLQEAGHIVEIFTSHHDPSRSFAETHDGTLKVHVLGNSLCPPSFRGKFTIVCSILRQLNLVISLILAITLHQLQGWPLTGWIIPAQTPCKSSADWSWRRAQEPYDVFFVDQLSACLPLLRWVLRTRAVFYCHFPDLLLNPSKIGHNTGGLRNLYRIPIDAIEEFSTGQADKVLVNSLFTQQVFCQTFPALQRTPRVVYPGIDVKAFQETSATNRDDASVQAIASDKPTLLSINRFEAKKNAALALEAFAIVAKQMPHIRLVLAGGFDPRLQDNVTTLGALQTLASTLDLHQHTFWPAAPSLSQSSIPRTRFEPVFSADQAPEATQVLFLPNFTQIQKSYMLQSSTTRALLYTPMNEHLGIVPLEAMASGLPVLASDTGGPCETVIDLATEPSEGTGYLLPNTVERWTDAIRALLEMTDEQRQRVASAGRRRVNAHFSTRSMCEKLDVALWETVSIRTMIWREPEFLNAIMIFSIPLLVICTFTFVLLNAPQHQRAVSQSI
ncbi:glycosyltransferase family 4 protein [Mixia osmundae IAM 14324]|uniref:Alpha-1,3/1,6-mannosyltransferase ALG2 n=1 Tax=Mixia osmundae (strain CBS 9802 / IAM 14324 / JCM 22182 / KY 12970) TaxID=764103 RepID=G7EA42_MIXOS|nr:glycosyltransferase family 4 protein [Mixia osmundae IAM 14324]KEI37599.1 glycosyltransferase family 4 protein [Mixia osmundae IAM 14324]GAA99702.1 hypothetical protein E5Q_06405 [Mixia osmundae IAM 14324]